MVDGGPQMYLKQPQSSPPPIVLPTQTDVAGLQVVSLVPPVQLGIPGPVQVLD